MPSILGANTLSSGFDVDNSLRFNDGSSDYLSRSVSSSGNRRTYTISTWFKRGSIGANQKVITAGTAGQEGGLQFYDGSSENTLRFYEYTGSDVIVIAPNRLLNDISAWYHVVIAVDTTQGTASNRVKYYLNGTQITSFATATYPDQNYDTKFNTSSVSNYIGFLDSHSAYYDGYMAETVLVDGQALDATSFGEFDSDSPNIWKPIDVSGLTFGTNGFYLQYKQSGTSQNSSGLGADTSGNDNHFAVSNLTAVDQSTDTCTNNFATLDPSYKQDHAFSEGNLGYTSSASDWDSAPGTIAVSSGKWYVEMKITGTASGVTRSVLGLCDERDGNLVAESEFGLTSSTAGDNVGYSNGDVHKNSSADSGSFASFGVNDILGMYVDLDNGKVYFSKNGTMQNSGDPTSGSTGTGAISITTGATYLFGATGYGGGASQMNFGSPPYAVSSGNEDPNGYGNFEYGTQNYYALNTKNLAEHG